jgi:hypothetical protein
MAEQQQDTDQNGHEEETASYEAELADYLQERIKPGLNRGAIPLLARSIAKEIARRERSRASGDTEAPDQSSGEADDKPSGESNAPPDFEADMHDLQKELGDDWILRFSVHGDDAWLTAEKDDGSGHVEAQTAAELVEAVGQLDEGGDRSS